MLPYQNIFKGWTWSWAHCGRIHLWKRWNSILSPSNQNSRSLFPVVQLKAKSLLLCEIARQFTLLCWVHQYSKLQSAFSWSFEASQGVGREGGQANQTNKSNVFFKHSQRVQSYSNEIWTLQIINERKRTNNFLMKLILLYHLPRESLRHLRKKGKIRKIANSFAWKSIQCHLNDSFQFKLIVYCRDMHRFCNWS